MPERPGENEAIEAGKSHRLFIPRGGFIQCSCGNDDGDPVGHFESIIEARVRAAVAAEIADKQALQTRIEYGHMTAVGWLPEYRGIKYARLQRTVHYRIDEPVTIDHWTYADHRHPLEDCTFCADKAASGEQPLTTRADVEARLAAARLARSVGEQR